MRRPSIALRALAALLFAATLVACDASWDNAEPNNEIKTANARDKEQKRIAAEGGPVAPEPAASGSAPTPAAAMPTNDTTTGTIPDTPAATPPPTPEAH